MFVTSLNLYWKPYLLMGYLAQPCLKVALNRGCAKGMAEEVERLLGTTVVPKD